MKNGICNALLAFAITLISVLVFASLAMPKIWHYYGIYAISYYGGFYISGGFRYLILFAAVIYGLLRGYMKQKVCYTEVSVVSVIAGALIVFSAP